MYSSVNSLPVFLLLDLVMLSTSSCDGSLLVSADLKSSLVRLPKIF